ncbi:MAG: hypothetical protein ACE5K9_02445 [Candidatus Methylomirabilales bacterium]
MGAQARLGFSSLPGYSQNVSTPPVDNRELVALAFRSLETGFARGGQEEATLALQEAFARRIRSCLLDVPSPEEMKELPEDLQQEIRQRQWEAALLREKRKAAVEIVPSYTDLLERYRAYDAAMGSPRRMARALGISATTVLIGGALGYVVERGTGLPYATAVGVGLGVIAFFSMMLQTLGTSRQMTQVESAHAAALERLREELCTTFEALDRRQRSERHQDPNA